MTFIEGIGDEVLEFFIGLLIIVIGVAAWWSTRIADRPQIRTVLIFERRTQNRNNQGNNNDVQQEPQQLQIEGRNCGQEVTVSDSVSTDAQQSDENKPSSIASTSVEGCDGSQNDASGSSREDEQEAIVKTMDSDTCVIRRRRLDFFQNRQDREVEQKDATNEDQTQSSNGDEDAPRIEDTSSEPSVPSIDENDIRIKLKYINDDLKLVNGKLQEPLGDFKRRHFEFELANNKLVRLIFNGQVLQRDDFTLQRCGLFDNCVVHCLVHQKRNGNDRNSSSTIPNLNNGNGDGTDPRSRLNNNNNNYSQSTGQHAGRDWDLGNLFFAIVSFVLGAAWYFQYEYAQLYTVTATVALVGLTGIFTVLLVGMYFPDPEPPVQTVRS